MASFSRNVDILAALRRPSSPSELLSAVSTLDTLSRELAADRDLRVHVGSSLPPIWLPLRCIWTDTAAAVENDRAKDEAAFVTSVAKITRNLVADVPQNQAQAFVLEPSIRRLIRAYTTWTLQGNEMAHQTTRMLTQALSNIVTANELLQDELWQLYVASAEDSSILLRLAESCDPGTLVALVVLLLNCMRSSPVRSAAFVQSSTGIRISVALLDKLELYLHDEGEASRGQVFEIGYTLFSSLFYHGQFPELFTQTGITDEAVSPPQTVLLKLLDAYLQSRSDMPSDGDIDLAGALVRIFHALSDSVQRAIRQAIGENGATSPPALDTQMPASCAALVLSSQCLAALLLAEAEIEAHTCKSAVLVARPGVIESIPETLRLLDVFLPRITFGKATPSPAAPQGNIGNPAAADATGFLYVKRDLVRLLGVLAHRDRSVQDRAREAGGITAVLNLCVIDERNPYLREHAILAIRNLLHDNLENQAVVEGLHPQGLWDVNSERRLGSGAI